MSFRFECTPVLATKGYSATCDDESLTGREKNTTGSVSLTVDHFTEVCFFNTLISASYLLDDNREYSGIDYILMEGRKVMLACFRKQIHFQCIIPNMLQ